VKLFTFWSFAPLSYIEHLCLRSMLTAGHAVDLYTYEDNLIVPKGVVVRQAADIIPRDQVVFHQRSGSPALFSDLFRYEGFKRVLGTWIDADVILLRSISDLGEHIFGWESPKLINGAVLRLPPNSPLLTYVDDLVRSRVPLPPYWSTGKMLRQLARACVGRQRRLEQLPWGTVGPLALSHFVSKNGLAKHAQPVDVFYPIPWPDAAAFFDPEQRIEDRFTERTRAVHLWNFKIRVEKLSRPPPGSYIARMCEHFGVDPDNASLNLARSSIG
jgi:alpha 1,4-glycosyltransferase